MLPTNKLDMKKKIRARIIHKNGNVYGLQLVNENNEDIGKSGKLIKDMNPREVWKDVGQLAVHKSRMSEIDIVGFGYE